MPMPKGKRFGDAGYCTLTNRPSMQFRKIADEMTKSGDKMNHATARGIFMRCMEKVATELLRDVKGLVRHEDVMRLVRDESFQSYIGDVIDDGETCDDS